MKPKSNKRGPIRKDGSPIIFTEVQYGLFDIRDGR